MKRVRSIIGMMVLYLFGIGNQLHYGDCIAQSKDIYQQAESASVPYVSLRLGSGIANFELGILNNYLDALVERSHTISSAPERKFLPYFVEFGVRIVGGFWICAEGVILRRDNTLSTSLPVNAWGSDVITYDSDITSSSATIISVGVKYEEQTISLADLYYYCRADIGLVSGQLKYEIRRSIMQTSSTDLDYGGNSIGFYLGGGVVYRLFSFISIDAEIGYRYARLDRLKDGERILQYSIDPGAIVLLEAKNEERGFEKMGLDFSGLNLKCGLRIIL